MGLLTKRSLVSDPLCLMLFLKADGSPLCLAAIDEAGDSCEDPLVTDKDGRVVLIRRSDLQ